MPKEMLTLYTKLFVNRGNGDENLIDLLSTPDLGIGDPEKVEVTNLQDGTRRYINGLKDVGDSLEFEFNYTTDGYGKLKEIEESKEIYIYKVVLPDELCFEFEAALSTKITGAAVGEQIKMTINLTPYSSIKVGQYGENNGTSYTTFTFRGSESAGESASYSARNTGTLVMVNNVPNSITELYVNDVPQQIPQISVEELLGGGDGVDDFTLMSVLQVNEGDIIKVKGGFSLAGNMMFENIINVSDIKLQDNLEDCSYMFMGCTTLIEAPVIPSSVKNCTYMFGMCENLAVIPQENLNLINNPQIGLVTQNCFAGCPLVADQIPSNWGGNADPIYPVIEYTTFTFMDSTSVDENNMNMLIMANNMPNSITELYINDVPQELPTLSITELMGGNADNKHFTILKLKTGDTVKIKGGFSLTANNADLLGGILTGNNEFNINNIILSNLIDCSFMFMGCTSLMEAPTIPEGVTDCTYMFAMTGIAETPVIPSSVRNCSYMFNGCTSLTKAPTMPINANVDYMFVGCTGLTDIGHENLEIIQNNPNPGENGCFEGCINIVDPISYNEIPFDWKNGV